MPWGGHCPPLWILRPGDEKLADTARPTQRDVPSFVSVPHWFAAVSNHVGIGAVSLWRRDQ